VPLFGEARYQWGSAARASPLATVAHRDRPAENAAMSGPGGPKGALGHRAESAVAAYLEQAGYTVVGRNVRLGRLEIDIVARRDALIAIVEVRTRGESSWTSGLGSLTHSKRERIRRAGRRLWRERYARDPSVSLLRFDAACVYFEAGPEPLVEYVLAAF
jgi:putative endonuclease